MNTPGTPVARRVPPGIAAMSDDALAVFLAQALVDTTVSEVARARALEHGLNAREVRERARRCRGPHKPDHAGN